MEPLPGGGVMQQPVAVVRGFVVARAFAAAAAYAAAERSQSVVARRQSV